MKVADAFKLAEGSMEGFIEKLNSLKLKELYELTDNLRFVSNRAVFDSAYRVLRKRFVEAYEYMKSSEKKRKGVDPDFFSERLSAYDMSGFELFHFESREFDDRPPSEIFKSFIETINKWDK
jgi:hypothetical protein